MMAWAHSSRKQGAHYSRLSVHCGERSQCKCECLKRKGRKLQRNANNNANTRLRLMVLSTNEPEIPKERRGQRLSKKCVRCSPHHSMAYSFALISTPRTLHHCFIIASSSDYSIERFNWIRRWRSTTALWAWLAISQTEDAHDALRNGGRSWEGQALQQMSREHYTDQMRQCWEYFAVIQTLMVKAAIRGRIDREAAAATGDNSISQVDRTKRKIARPTSKRHSAKSMQKGQCELTSCVCLLSTKVVPLKEG